jgi:hypothetical protein
MKKKVKNAMKLAKKLEKIPNFKDEEMLRIYKNTKSSVARLNEILGYDFSGKRKNKYGGKVFKKKR